MKTIFIQFAGTVFNERSGWKIGGDSKSPREPDWPVIRAITSRCQEEGWKLVPIEAAYNQGRPEDLHTELRATTLYPHIHPDFLKEPTTTPVESPFLEFSPEQPRRRIKEWLDSHPETTNWLILATGEGNYDSEQKDHLIKGCRANGMNIDKLKEFSVRKGTAASMLNWINISLTTPPLGIPVTFRDINGGRWNKILTEEDNTLHNYETGNHPVQWAPVELERPSAEQAKQMPMVRMVTRMILVRSDNNPPIRPPLRERRTIPQGLLIPATLAGGTDALVCIPANHKGLASGRYLPYFNGYSHKIIEIHENEPEHASI